MSLAPCQSAMHRLPLQSCSALVLPARTRLASVQLCSASSSHAPTASASCLLAEAVCSVHSLHCTCSEALSCTVQTAAGSLLALAPTPAFASQGHLLQHKRQHACSSRRCSALMARIRCNAEVLSAAQAWAR